MPARAHALPPRFDPTDPANIDDPYPAYADLRRAGAVCRFGPGQWGVTRHADVTELLRDKRGDAWDYLEINLRCGGTTHSLLAPTSYYGDLRRAADSEKESIIDDVVFEIELVKQVEVNVDYILMLVEQYREERGDGTDREVETLAKIRRAIDSSISLRNKRDLILAFVDRVSVDSDVKEDWRRYVEARRDEELEHLIADQGLDPDATRAFVERAFRNGAIPTAGAAVTHILPPLSRFADDSYGIRKQTVLDRLTAFFDRLRTGLRGDGPVSALEAAIRAIHERAQRELVQLTVAPRPRGAEPR